MTPGFSTFDPAPRRPAIAHPRWLQRAPRPVTATHPDDGSPFRSTRYPAAPFAVASTGPAGCEVRRPALSARASRPSANRILFLDGRTADLTAIITAAAGRLTIVLLDAHSDGVSQVAHHLRGHAGLDAVLIATVDEAGCLSLGSACLTVGNLYAYEDELRRIGGALSPVGRVRMLGRGPRSDGSDKPLMIMLSRLMGATAEACPEPASAIRWEKDGPWEADGEPPATAFDLEDRRVA